MHTIEIHTEDIPLVKYALRIAIDEFRRSQRRLACPDEDMEAAIKRLEQYADKMKG
jgi:hypothetical protein